MRMPRRLRARLPEDGGEVAAEGDEAHEAGSRAALGPADWDRPPPSTGRSGRQIQRKSVNVTHCLITQADYKPSAWFSPTGQRCEIDFQRTRPVNNVFVSSLFEIENKTFLPC